MFVNIFVCLSVTNACEPVCNLDPTWLVKKVYNSYRINLEVDIQVLVEGFWNRNHAFGTRGMHST